MTLGRVTRRGFISALLGTVTAGAADAALPGRSLLARRGLQYLGLTGTSLPASFIRPAIRTVPAISGTTYYVNGSTGSDSNTGKSQAQAWKTLDYATSQIYNLTAGDAVLFAGGQTFVGTGALYMGPLGTASKPFQIGSYGTGRATLQVPVAGGPVVCPYAISYQVISNLIIDGGNTADQGLYIGSDGSRAVTETGFTVINCDFINCKTVGAMVQVDAAGKKITNVVFSGCTARNNTGAGFQTFSQDAGAQGYAGKASRSITGLVMENCTAYSNGSAGFLPAQCSGTVSWCLAYNNGATTTNQSGFWWYDCTNLYVTFCESYGNTSSNHIDGAGFDQDGGNYQCGVEFCYAHDNSGPGFEQVSYATKGSSSDSYVRNCVAMNNCTNATTPEDLLFYADTASTMTNMYFYNNTVIRNTSSASGGAFGTSVSGTGAYSGCVVANNLFHCTSGASYQMHLNTFAGLVFSNNLYSGPTNFYYNGGTTTTAIATWKAASGESNAQIENETYLPTVAPATGGYDPVALATNFRPAAGSLAATAGIDQNVANALPTPTNDAFGDVFAWTTIGAGH